MSVSVEGSKDYAKVSEKGYEGKSMAAFFKNNGFNTANLLTLFVVAVSAALFLGTTRADVAHLKVSMLQTESREVAENREKSIIGEISVLREGVREDISVLRGDIREVRNDIHRLESKVDEIILRLP